MTSGTVSIAKGPRLPWLQGLAAIVMVFACGRGPTGTGPAADLPASARWSAQQIGPASGSRPLDGVAPPYEVLDPPVPGAAATGKVRVLEFFWYACPHCYALEDDLHAWLRERDPSIEFTRVPVAWRADVTAHARLFYVLRALGRTDLDDEVFAAIHLQANRLVGPDAQETYRLQLEFATAQGISATRFATAYSSQPVNSQLENAQELARACHIDGVPSFVIDGRFLTSARRAGGRDKLVAVVATLANQASQH